MHLPIIDSNIPFQKPYQPIIQELVGFLSNGIGDNLHSLYLYGSVARKTAKPGLSNIDVIVVTHKPFADVRTTLFNSIKWRFQKSYPYLMEVSFKTALASEVASLDSIFSWGFQLRHCSVCIYGEDLSECFGDYEPSWEIAKHWNMDVEDWVAVYRNRIARADKAEEQIKAQKIIAKKLLRASYSLIMYRDKRWFDDPVRCGQEFLRYHPDKKIDVDRLAILMSGRLIPKRSVIGILDSFGSWLASQYKKTEFRIG